MSSNKQTSTSLLPDPMRQESSPKQPLAPLEWVGMEKMEVLLKLDLDQLGVLHIPGLIAAQVSLDKTVSRGIHMSRLYALVQKAFEKTLHDFQGLKNLVEGFRHTHADLSTSARILLRFHLPVQRKALKSSEQGIRNYPIALGAQYRWGRWEFWSRFRILYSSTCPASAALTRRLNQENFKNHFQRETLLRDQVSHWLGEESSVVATPHAQRSVAQIRIQTPPSTTLTDLMHTIDEIEAALQTPVQGPVKREDEQEFAKRNGQNLMFCEDAARKVQSFLENQPQILSFSGKFTHLESLHPHNAVAHIKGPSRSL